MIRKATLNDVKAIADIYNYYVKTSIATFAEKNISEEEIRHNLNNSVFWFVYEEEGKVLGYASANKWNKRCSYRYTLEVSIYLKIHMLGKGIGVKLYERLLSEIKKTNTHSVIGGVSLPNIASVKLHEKFGFKKVAHFNEVGFKFNKWIDVGYWELILA